MAFRKVFKLLFNNADNAYYKFGESFKNLAVSKRIKWHRTYSKLLFASAATVGLSLYALEKTPQREHIPENKEPNVVPEIESYDDAINKSRELLLRVKDETGAPGIIIGVSIDGKTVWMEGLGYADVENQVPCSGDTVMRIASISKSMTMVTVAKLWEQGKLDLDKPVQDYVPYFPNKTFDGKPVVITCRQLVSHLGGIRHYEKNDKNNEQPTKKSEFEFKEYYIKQHYNDVKSSLELFKGDPLLSKPGTKFHYSTHGWTLVSAIVETASKEQFHIHMTKLFKKLGMLHTYLDENDVLIYHRSRNYIKNKNGRLINAPYVDNSYKWAGGGFLSTVGDLIHFANAMLYSLQFKKEPHTDSKLLPGYLDSKTVQVMWSPIAKAKEFSYGMGWEVIPEEQECEYCQKYRHCAYHTGGAIGASSVLFIMPKKNENRMAHPPKGTVVVILANLQSVGLHKTALKIAQFFDNS